MGVSMHRHAKNEAREWKTGEPKQSNIGHYGQTTETGHCGRGGRGCT